MFYKINKQASKHANKPINPFHFTKKQWHELNLCTCFWNCSSYLSHWWPTRDSDCQEVQRHQAAATKIDGGCMIEWLKDILILTDRVRKYIQKYILIASKLRALAIANHVNKHLQSSCKGLKLTVGMWGCHQTATKQMKTDCKWARKVWAWKTHRADCIPFSGVTEGY